MKIDIVIPTKCLNSVEKATIPVKVKKFEEKSVCEDSESRRV